MRTVRIAALALALTSAPLAAHDYRAGALVVDHPWIPATAAAARTAAGYMTISNEGDAPDRLVGVRSALPHATIHTTEVDAAGVARMREVEAVEIPPGGSVAFAPQGLHVMFMGLEAGLDAGATIDATLVFEGAGEVPVQFNVEDKGPQGTEHDGHGAGG